MVEVAGEKSLVGTWELLSREDVTPDGQPRIEPTLGRDPVALLIYDAAGNFAVQFMKRNREQGDGVAARTASPGTNQSGAIDGYDAYFGRYTAGENGTVRQELVGALSPKDVGKVVTRTFQIRGSELIIELETMASDGQAVKRTLRWRRVA